VLRLPGQYGGLVGALVGAKSSLVRIISMLRNVPTFTKNPDFPLLKFQGIKNRDYL
jgi:hypothetical protein